MNQLSVQTAAILIVRTVKTLVTSVTVVPLGVALVLVETP